MSHSSDEWIVAELDYIAERRRVMVTNVVILALTIAMLVLAIVS